MYRELSGKWSYAAGSSGTVTIPSSANVLAIWAWASTGSPTVAIFGGTAIPIPATGQPVRLQFMHDLVHAQGTSGAAQIVFTATAGYFVEYVSPPGGV